MIILKRFLAQASQDFLIKIESALKVCESMSRTPGELI